MGYPSFTTTPPFDPSLFVTIRKRMGMDTVNALNERIIALKTKMGELPSEEKNDESRCRGIVVLS